MTLYKDYQPHNVWITLTLTKLPTLRLLPNVSKCLDKRRPRLEHITIPEEPLNLQNSIEMDEQFYLVWEFGKQLGVLKKCILYAETFFKVYLTLEPNAVSNIKIVAISCLAIAASLYDMYDFSYVGGVEFYGKGHDHLAHCIVRILGVTKGVLSDLEL
jgi:hypothetical protein